MTPAFRTDVIGSLLRPEYLKEAPLAHVPDDRTVVLGLVTTKKPALERADALERRIDAASTCVPPERLALSPRWGFASTEAGNALTPADEEAKLRLVAEVAREVWGEPAPPHSSGGTAAAAAGRVAAAPAGGR